MLVTEIIKNKLVELQADGLCNPDLNCYCSMEEICRCESWIGDCFVADEVGGRVFPMFQIKEK